MLVHAVRMLVDWVNLKRGEDGQGLVEYSLIIALVSIVSIAALLLMGPAVADVFTAITGELTPAP